MRLYLTSDAIHWLKEQLDLHDGDALRFFAQYGGESLNHPGFSFGLCRERPKNVLASTSEDGVLFFVRGEDEWFFGDSDLWVDIQNDDIKFVMSPTGMRVSH